MIPQLWNYAWSFFEEDQTNSFLSFKSKYLERGYSSELASKLAFYSKIAYYDKKQIQNWSFNSNDNIPQSLFLKEIQIHQQLSLNIQTYIGYDQNKNQIIVVFRGTQPTSVINWMLDAYTKKVYWQGYIPGTNNQVWVHSGFDLSYDSVREWVCLKLKEKAQKYKNATILVCGHSLGGAIANLFAVQATNIVQNQVILYTYGQPRVGNKSFANLTNVRVKTYYRVIHDDDIVARVPNFAYYHSGKEVIYDERMKNFKICEADSKYLSQTLDYIDILTDHSSSQYIKILVANKYLLGKANIQQDWRKSSFYDKQKERNKIQPKIMQLKNRKRVQSVQRLTVRNN